MSQEANITGSFIWTFEDVKIRQEVLAGRPVTTGGKVMTYIITLVVLVIAFAVTNLRSLFADPYLASITVGGIILFYLIFSYSQRANLKKGFLQSPDSNKHIEVMFTQDEIVMKAEGIYENRWKWNVIKEVQQNPKGFCFFLAEKFGFWIPIRAFQSQADINALIELAKQRVPKFKALV